MQLAFPDGTFIMVTNILTEAYLFTLNLLMAREMRFTIQYGLPWLKFSVKSVTLCQSLLSKMNQYIFSLFFSTMVCVVQFSDCPGLCLYSFERRA